MLPNLLKEYDIILFTMKYFIEVTFDENTISSMNTLDLTFI